MIHLISCLFILQQIKTEQEELNDLLKELEEESKMEAQINNDFVMKLNDLEKRLNILKKSQPSTDEDANVNHKDSPNEQTVIREILGKVRPNYSSVD